MKLGNVHAENANALVIHTVTLVDVKNILSYDNRGKDGAWGAWEAHHKVSVVAGGSDTLSNCEILCMDCHKKTGSYGG